MCARDIEVREVGTVGFMAIEVAVVERRAGGGDGGREEVRWVREDVTAEVEVFEQTAVESELRAVCERGAESAKGVDKNLRANKTGEL